MSLKREQAEEGIPPTKRLKVQEEEKDGQVKDEGMEPEGGDENKTGKEEDNYSLLSMLREEDVGITEYISKQAGVSAIIKQRYSDFVVNEISISGEVVHLTNTDVPVIVEEAEPSGPVDTVLSEDFLASLKQVAAGSIPTASIPAGDNKDVRLRVHRAVKSAFPNVETKTEDKDGEKVITAMLKAAVKDKRRGQEWPSSKARFPFCGFVLYKENKGTMDVIHLMARYLKVKDNVFQYAGTKDKRGKTTQQITAHKIPPKRLQDLNKFLRNITVGNFSYVENKLRLGDLKGNRFTIVLRNVVGEEEDIEKGLTSLREVGFVNYYGLQRFGSLSVPTHMVGRALLKEDYEEAVNLIIAGDKSDGFPYRKVWTETKDPEKTMESLQHRHFTERMVLRSLIKRPTDFCGAVQSIPRNLRLIYPHAYQSMVWNIMASRRIKTFGLKPVVGDLVLPSGAVADAEVEPEMVDADGENGSQEEEHPQNKKTRERVKPIVLEDGKVSQYTIYDVVLPLPGFDVLYPNNEVHTWYKEHLEKDGFDINSMERKNRDFSLPGSYRAIVVQPTDVEWKTFRYNDPTVALALSDSDRMDGVEEPQSVEDGKLRALRLTFNLPTSSYATMALREVLKTDTSPAQQASMNVT
ncbi:pseudouridylate synthase 7 homolog isoform X2 [Littorina saxatilis]|uniref:pseudouridylate synthase 7 homolog isoform X2 n=1 Tax=Littorina saxatilis TaxID=31220 RepID=UPI0038B43D1E